VSDTQHTINQMRRVFDECLELASKKNADYGDAWRESGWRGNLSRIFEKTKRLRTLLWRGDAYQPYADEGARETMLDIINTTCFTVLNRDAGVEWGHEQPFHDADTSLWRSDSLQEPNVTPWNPEGDDRPGIHAPDVGSGYGDPVALPVREPATTALPPIPEKESESKPTPRKRAIAPK